MLSKLPTGSSPDKSEAAVAPDREFTSVLTSAGALILAFNAAADDAIEAAAAADGAVEVAADDVFDEALEVEPVALEPDFCAAAICAFTRLSACELAMPARPVV
jgi:hypothetical protein